MQLRCDGWCDTFPHAPKAYITGKACITHGVCITFRKERITQQKKQPSQKAAFLLCVRATKRCVKWGKNGQKYTLNRSVNWNLFNYLWKSISLSNQIICWTSNRNLSFRHFSNSRRFPQLPAHRKRQPQANPLDA